MQKKWYQNGAPGVLLLQMVPGSLEHLRIPYYGQSSSAPRGTVLAPFFSECGVKLCNNCVTVR